jgi:hypothetical protein
MLDTIESKYVGQREKLLNEEIANLKKRLDESEKINFELKKKNVELEKDLASLKGGLVAFPYLFLFVFVVILKMSFLRVGKLNGAGPKEVGRRWW